MVSPDPNANHSSCSISRLGNALSSSSLPPKEKLEWRGVLNQLSKAWTDWIESEDFIGCETKYGGMTQIGVRARRTMVGPRPQPHAESSSQAATRAAAGSTSVRELPGLEFVCVYVGDYETEAFGVNTPLDRRLEGKVGIDMTIAFHTGSGPATRSAGAGPGRLVNVCAGTWTGADFKHDCGKHVNATWTPYAPRKGSGSSWIQSTTVPPGTTVQSGQEILVNYGAYCKYLDYRWH